MTTAFQGFPANERRLLLSLPRIGPTVVERIEAQGITSLHDLHRKGVDRVVEAICREMGTPAWANRRRALIEALAASAKLPPERRRPSSEEGLVAPHAVGGLQGSRRSSAVER
jgi:hypothetical protein